MIDHYKLFLILQEDATVDSSKDTSLCVPETQTQATCKNHSSPLYFHCNTCNHSLCPTCLLNYSCQKHEIKLVETMKNEHMQKLSSILQSIKQDHDTLVESLSKEADERKAVIATQEKELEKLESFFENVNAALKGKKQEYELYLEGLENELLLKADKHKNSLLRFCTKVNNELKYMEDLLVTRPQVFSNIDAHEFIMKQLTEDSQAHMSDTLLLPEELSLSFVPSVSLVTNQFPSGILMSTDAPVLSTPAAYQLNHINYLHFMFPQKSEEPTAAAGITVKIQVVSSEKDVQALVESNFNSNYLIAFKPEVRGRHIVVVENDKLTPLLTKTIVIPPNLYSINHPVNKFPHINSCSITANSNVMVGNDNDIQTLNNKTGELRRFNHSNLTSYTFGLTVGDDGCVYQSSLESGHISKFDKDGHLVSQIKVQSPHGLEISNEMLFVCCTYETTHHLLVYDLNLQFMKTIGKFGKGEGEFNECTDIAFDHKNQWMYVVESGNNRVQVLDTNGTFLHYIGIQDSGESILSEPQGISINGGYVYVTEKGGSRVSMFSSSGQLVTHIGEGYLQSPSGIDIDQDGYVWVCDTAKETVFVF